MSAQKTKAVTHAMPFDDWPEQDKSAWRHAVTTGSILDPAGLAAHFTQATRKIILSNYGRWLNYLLKNRQLTPHDIAQRVTSEKIKAYTELLQNSLNPSSVVTYIRSIHTAMCVMAPTHDWQWLHQFYTRLDKALPARIDKRIRMQDSVSLYTLGIELMNQARADKDTQPFSSILRFRDGLIISLLAARPIRLGNLAIIQINQHLIKANDHWWLRFEHSETKNKRPLELMLPESLTPYLEYYLYHVRGKFKNADQHNHLWASSRGNPMTDIGLYKCITHQTQIAFNTAINPHLFRDCAATSIAIHDPVHVRSASALLGHADLRTTEKYYNQAMTVDAVRGYQSALGSLMEQLGSENEG